MTGSIPGDLVSRITEAIGVEIWFPARSGMIKADARCQIGTGDIGPLIAIGQARGRHHDRNGLSSLKSHESIQRPAAYDRIRDAIHPIADPAPAAKGKVVDDRHREPVRGIVRAYPVFGSQVVEDLRIIKLQVADPGVRS